MTIEAEKRSITVVGRRSTATVKGGATQVFLFMSINHSATASSGQTARTSDLVTASHQQPNSLLSRTEAASFLKVSPQTLAAWACNKRVNLPYIKIGRRVAYRQDDLIAFVDANVHAQTTSVTGELQ